MATPSVDVSPGQDPSVLGNPVEPSGFERMSRTDVDAWCGIVKDEIETTLSRAPDALVDALGSPLRVPLYIAQNIRDSARTILTNANRLTFQGHHATRQVWPVGYAPPQLKGMVLDANARADVQGMRRNVGHEALHILSMRAMHGHFLAPWEAMVARLEKEHHGQRTGLIQQQPWDFAAASATTGLRPPDFAKTEYGNVAYEALYLSSYAALDRLRADQVWAIWTTLTARTQATGLMPKWAEVEQAILDVAQQEGEAALRTPAFREMQTGTQVFLYPTTDGRARAYNFNVTQRADWGNITGPTRQETLFDCRGTRTGPHRHILYEASGALSPMEGRLNFDQTQDLTYDLLAQRLAAAGPVGQQLLSTLGPTMQVEVQGLPPVTLNRP